MANPQAENGHTDIANEIMDALCKFRIPGEVRQIVDFVIRKTYGWHKKEDRIANTQFIDGTGLSKGSVSRSFKKAIEHKLVIVSATKVRFNKNYDDWIEFGGKHFNPKKVIVSATKVIASDNKKLSQVRDTKEKKETIQKKDETNERFSLISSLNWKRVLRAWKEGGHKVINNQKLTQKRSGDWFLIDQNNKWTKCDKLGNIIK